MLPYRPVYHNKRNLMTLQHNCLLIDINLKLPISNSNKYPSLNQAETIYAYCV